MAAIRTRQEAGRVSAGRTRSRRVSDLCVAWRHRDTHVCPRRGRLRDRLLPQGVLGEGRGQIPAQAGSAQTLRRKTPTATT